MRLSCRAGADTIYIAGSFNKWVPIEMKRNQDSKSVVWFYDLVYSRPFEFKFLLKTKNNYVWEKGDNRKGDRQSSSVVYEFGSPKIIDIRSRGMKPKVDVKLFKKYKGVLVRIYKIPVYEIIRSLRTTVRSVPIDETLCLYANNFITAPNKIYKLLHNIIGNQQVILRFEGVVDNCYDDTSMTFRSSFQSEVYVNKQRVLETEGVPITSGAIHYDMLYLIQDIANTKNTIQIYLSNSIQIESRNLYFYQPTVFNLLYSNLPIHMVKNHILQTPYQSKQIIHINQYIDDLRKHRNIIPFIFNFSCGTIEELLFIIETTASCTLIGKVATYKNISNLLNQLGDSKLQTTIIKLLMRKKRFWLPHLFRHFAKTASDVALWFRRLSVSHDEMLLLLAQYYHEHSLKALGLLLRSLNMNTAIIPDILALYRTHRYKWKVVGSVWSRLHIFQVNTKFMSSCQFKRKTIFPSRKSPSEVLVTTPMLIQYFCK